MALSEHPQGIREYAALCLERARRLVKNPLEALEMAEDARRLVEQMVRRGLEALAPLRRHAEEPIEYRVPAAEPAAPATPVAAATPAPHGGNGGSAAPAEGPGPDGEAAEEAAEHDQLYKVMRALHDEALGEKRYLTAREIAEASEEAGLKILPGNVRKILRTRATSFVEARLRSGENGKVTEFRLAARGRTWFEKTYPVH